MFSQYWHQRAKSTWLSCVQSDTATTTSHH